MKKPSRKQQIEGLAVAACNVLLKAELPNFPKAAFGVCVLCGRLDEAAKILNDYLKNEQK